MALALENIYINGSLESSNSITVYAGSSATYSKSGYTTSISVVMAGSGWKYTISGNNISWSAVSSSTAFSYNVNYTSSTTTYTISYNANGGSVSPSSGTCTAGSSITTPVPTRNGYTCKGWYTSTTSSATKRCNAGASYTPTKSETIYAQWDTASTDVYAYFKIASGQTSNIVLFAETSTGYFTEIISGTSSTKVESSSTPLRAVAIPIVAGKYVSTWTKASTATLTNYGLISVSSSSTTVNYPSATATTSNGPDITVVDAHGTHYGTPTGTNMKFRASSVVGVRHKTTDAGYVFNGWTVTRGTSSTSTTYGQWLSVGGTTSGTTTTFPASYDDTAAVVFKTGTSTASAGSVTFTANYTQVAQATVTYDPNGGKTTPASQTGYVGQDITLAAAIEKDLADFYRWQIGSTLYAAGSQYTLTGNVTAKAIWTDKTTYVVSFDKNATDVTGADIPTIMVTAGSSVTLPDANLWERSGYVFSGWTIDSGGSGTVYVAGDTYTPSGNTIFYAKWASSAGVGAKADYEMHTTSSTLQTKCTSNYNLQISSNVLTTLALYWDNISSPKIVEKKSQYNPTFSPNPKVTTTTKQEQGDYIRTGGTVPAYGSSSPFLQVLMPLSNINDYTFQSTKASSEYYTTTETTKTTTIKDAMVFIAPTVTNYEFDGWYTLDKSYDTSVPISDNMFTTKMSTDLTVSFNTVLRKKLNWTCYQNTSGTGYEIKKYLNFIRLKYLGVKVLVLFDANGGILTDFYKEVRYGQTYGTLPTPTWGGRTFQGWYTASSGGTQVLSTTTVTNASEHILYAHWSAAPTQTVTATFDGMGGTPSSLTQTYTAGTTYGTLPTATWSGLTLDGWYDMPFGGSKVTTSSTVPDEDHTLYAYWTSQIYTITLNPSGGSVSPTTLQVPAGNNYGILPIPTKSGSTFSGWYTASSGGTKITSASVPTQSTTIYAQWESSSATPRGYIKYTINFILNGGTLVSSYEKAYMRGYSKTLPSGSQITKSGATFSGWYENASFTIGPVTQIPATATGTKTYYAKWT